MEVNQAAGVQAIAEEHRVTPRFAKREFDILFFSADTTRFRDQIHEPVHKRRDQTDVGVQPGVNL